MGLTIPPSLWATESDIFRTTTAAVTRTTATTMCRWAVSSTFVALSWPRTAATTTPPPPPTPTPPPATTTTTTTTRTRTTTTTTATTTTTTPQEQQQQRQERQEEQQHDPTKIATFHGRVGLTVPLSLWTTENRIVQYQQITLP